MTFSNDGAQAFEKGHFNLQYLKYAAAAFTGTA